MSHLKDRLVEAMRRHLELSQAEIARACKVKSPSVTDWLNGNTRSLKPEPARLAAKLFGCDQNWLGQGTGNPNWNDATPVESASPPTLEAALGMVLSRLPGLDTYTAGKVVATEQAAQTSSDSVVQRAPRHTVPNARPVSARRRALQTQGADGQAALAIARRSLGGMLQAHGLAPLAALRHRAGLSQLEAAELSGIMQPHISRLENGLVSAPELATLRALAAAYKCSLADVVQAIDECTPGAASHG